MVFQFFVCGRGRDRAVWSPRLHVSTLIVQIPHDSCSPPLSAPSLPISPSSPWRGDKELIIITITICDPHGLWGRSRNRRSAVVVWSPAPLPSLLGGGRRIRTAPASRSQAMSKHPADISFFSPCCVAELHSHGTRNENHYSIMNVIQIAAEVRGVEPLSVGEPSVVASLACCRRLPSVIAPHLTAGGM